MAPAPSQRRSTRPKVTPASSHDDSGDRPNAPEHDHDARPARPLRASKRPRGNDAPGRNTRAKRPNTGVGQTSSFRGQSAGSGAFRERGAAPNASATPEPTDDTRVRNLLNSSMDRRANEIVDAAYSSDNGDASESDDDSGMRINRLDADQGRDMQERRSSSPSEHQEDSDGPTPIQASGTDPGAAYLTIQHLDGLYENQSETSDEDVNNGEGNTSNGGADVDSGADTVDSDVDFEVESDTDEDNSLSLTDAFSEDIIKLGNRAAAQPEDPLFIGPGGSPTTIHMEPKPFLKVFKHMKRKGWTGVRQDWDTRIVQTPPKTTIGTVLTHFVRKTERLYKMGSGQSDIAAQIDFFNEHTQPLQYYFGIVAECVRFIREKRLPLDKTEPLSKADDKRKQMAMDLADPLIPWLVRLLKAGWQLGSSGSFDMFTISLLTRTVGWIRQLYNPLQRETKATPVPEKMKKERAKPTNRPGSNSKVEKRRKEEEQWRQWAKFQEARDQLDAMLQELEALLNKAPDMLLAEEERQARAEAEKEALRELEAQQAEQDRLEQEQRERDRMLQNRNVARSLRREADDGWIEAEVDYLREQLQGATYDDPRLPSLQDTATRVGHSVEDTMEKSKKELRRMLGRMWGDVRSPKQIEVEVKNLMQLWRLRYP